MIEKKGQGQDKEIDWSAMTAHFERRAKDPTPKHLRAQRILIDPVKARVEDALVIPGT